VHPAQNAFSVPGSLKRRATRAKIALVMGQAFKERMGVLGEEVEEDEEDEGDEGDGDGEGGVPRPSVHAARRTGMAIEREVTGVTSKVRRREECGEMRRELLTARARTIQYTPLSVPQSKHPHPTTPNTTHNSRPPPSSARPPIFFPSRWPSY
jgi:hypothetical protein